MRGQVKQTVVWEHKHSRLYSFCNSLNNYRGLGTVDIQMPRRVGPGTEAPDGWLWLEPPDCRFPNGTVEQHLHDLCHRYVARCTYCMVTKSVARVRVWVLPDDVGRGLLPIRDANSKKALKKILEVIDVSEDGWKGLPVEKNTPLVELEDERSSLFYMFNTLQSPNPDPDAPEVNDTNTKVLLKSILKSDPIPGIRTSLYQYQKHSVAMMLQRELAPGRSRDSRLRAAISPNGEECFIDFEAVKIYKEPSYYEDIRGGILAEEMGTGKTLICLAVIAASQHQISYVPEEHSLILPRRDHAPSLVDACIASIWRNAIPWAGYANEFGDHLTKRIKENRSYYEIRRDRSRSGRYAGGQKEKVFLGTGTIVVCPVNLVEQWRTEIEKHVQPGCLKVLILAHATAVIPPVETLLEYDLVIFSRTRFDQEEKAGKDKLGRRESGGVAVRCQCPYIGATRTRDCRCFDKSATYKSPLFSIHWKRLIVDEGHFMGGGKTNGACVAEKLLVERRWIVSGTPSSGLLGVAAGVTVREGETAEELALRKKQLLTAKKDAQAKENVDLDRLGRMVREFLRLQPWASAVARGEQVPWASAVARGEQVPSWSNYVTKGFAERRIGATTCVKNILNTLFIRHREEDIGQSTELPPLYHRFVSIEPGYFERLSQNLFLGALAVNAVTSERTDRDYMFHAQNRAHLRQLINNMTKQAGFHWTGFKKREVEQTVEIAQAYLSTCNSATLDEHDRELLQSAIASGTAALDSGAWRYTTEFHEMGYFVAGLPADVSRKWVATASDYWMNAEKPCTMLGADAVLTMQRCVVENGHRADHVRELAEAGLLYWPAKNLESEGRKRKHRNEKERPKNANLAKALQSQPERRNTKVGVASGRTGLPKVSYKENAGYDENAGNAGLLGAEKSSGLPGGEKSLKPALKRTAPSDESVLPKNSPLRDTKITGTASKKLSYLLDCIQAHHRTEKILIFYESDNVAWHIAHALEILGIEYLAYQKNLSGKLKASYVVTFQRSKKVRVMLMDLTQASHGLNITAASRVYFVNPVWQPNIEAQALKRAHRIGQTRPVYVETLVLAGTIEEELVKRRNAMSMDELKCSKDSVDDFQMRHIIQNLQFLPIPSPAVEVDKEGKEWDVPFVPGQSATLKTPATVFSHYQRGGLREGEDRDNVVIHAEGYNDGRSKPTASRPKKHARFESPDPPSRRRSSPVRGDLVAEPERRGNVASGSSRRQASAGEKRPHVVEPEDSEPSKRRKIEESGHGESDKKRKAEEPEDEEPALHRRKAVRFAL